MMWWIFVNQFKVLFPFDYKSLESFIFYWITKIWDPNTLRTHTHTDYCLRKCCCWNMDVRCTMNPTCPQFSHDRSYISGKITAAGLNLSSAVLSGATSGPGYKKPPDWLCDLWIRKPIVFFCLILIHFVPGEYAARINQETVLWLLEVQMNLHFKSEQRLRGPE